MITRTSRVLLVLLLLIASLTASVADSVKDKLAAGRIDEAIAELNGRLSSARRMRNRPTCSAVLTSRSRIGIVRNRRAERRPPSIRGTAVSICGWGACTAKRRIGQI